MSSAGYVRCEHEAGMEWRKRSSAAKYINKNTPRNIRASGGTCHIFPTPRPTALASKLSSSSSRNGHHLDCPSGPHTSTRSLSGSRPGRHAPSCPSTASVTSKTARSMLLKGRKPFMCCSMLPSGGSPGRRGALLARLSARYSFAASKAAQRATSMVSRSGRAMSSNCGIHT